LKWAPNVANCCTGGCIAASGARLGCLPIAFSVAAQSPAGKLFLPFFSVLL